MLLKLTTGFFSGFGFAGAVGFGLVALAGFAGFGFAGVAGFDGSLR
jgi:hypothetical protein